MSGDLSRQLAALGAMASDELRLRWRELTDSPVPRISPGLLRLALAWEIQARTQGGLSRKTQQTLVQLARGRTRTSEVVPGMRLVREWNGKVHIVDVDSDGVIRWNGKSWRSLSEVAREITGTRWSGPAFFALKRKVGA